MKKQSESPSEIDSWSFSEEDYWRSMIHDTFDFSPEHSKRPKKTEKPDSLSETDSWSGTDFSSSSEEAEVRRSMIQNTPTKRDLTFAFYPEHSKKPKTEKPVMRWTYEDKVALLKGIVEFQEQKGAYPTADSTGFHDFVKDSLHLEFNRTQVIGKVRTLKQWYTGANQPYKGFKRLIISSSNLASFELAKKIWGEDVHNEVIYRDRNGKMHNGTYRHGSIHHFPTSAKIRVFGSCNGKSGSLQEKQGKSNSGLNGHVCEIKDDGRKKPNMVWSYEDKVALLKRIVEYGEEKGVYPTEDPDGFHGFVKESLHLGFDRKQVIGKIGTLKSRYTSKIRAVNRLFVRHDNAVAFQLAKKIWGKDVSDNVIYVDVNGIKHDMIASWSSGNALNGYCHRCTHYLPSSAAIGDFDSYFKE